MKKEAKKRVSIVSVSLVKESSFLSPILATNF